MEPEPRCLQRNETSAREETLLLPHQTELAPTLSLYTPLHKYEPFNNPVCATAVGHERQKHTDAVFCLRAAFNLALSPEVYFSVNV